MITIAKLSTLVEADVVHLKRIVRDIKSIKYATLQSKIIRNTELTVTESAEIEEALHDLHKFLKKVKIRSSKDMIALRDDKRVVMTALINKAGYSYHTVAAYMSRGKPMSEESCTKFDEQVKLIVKFLDELV